MEPIIIAFIVFIAIRIVAGMDIPFISLILRCWWNLSFKIAAFIPFCGWMTCFIIVKDGEVSEEEKQFYRETGRGTDDATYAWMEESAARAKAEQEAYEAQRQQAEAERLALQDELRARTYNTYGRTDVYLNSDGSKVRVGDSDYIPVEEYKRNLY